MAIHSLPTANGSCPVYAPIVEKPDKHEAYQAKMETGNEEEKGRLENFAARGSIEYCGAYAITTNELTIDYRKQTPINVKIAINESLVFQ